MFRPKPNMRCHLVRGRGFVSDRSWWFWPEIVGSLDIRIDPSRRREALEERAYLIRYGVMGHIGKFAALPGCETSLERDQLVVIQTHRGL